MPAPFRLAVAQPPAELAPPDRMAWLCDTLKSVTADLILLPELFASGYNIGAAIQDRAEPSDGPTAQKISDLARTHSIAIHYGFPERAADGLYNAAQCFGPDGQRLTHQRKLAIPPGGERDYFTAGQGCHLFEYNGITIATLICYDAEFPETVRHVAAKGAQLVLVPTALGDRWDWVARTMIPTRAFENGVYLAYANSAGTENGLSFLGHSFIAAPDGTESARAGDTPEILYAELDPAKVSAAQARLPYIKDRLSLALD